MLCQIYNTLGKKVRTWVGKVEGLLRSKPNTQSQLHRDLIPRPEHIVLDVSTWYQRGQFLRRDGDLIIGGVITLIHDGDKE